MPSNSKLLNIFISTPLEPDHAKRISEVDSKRLNLIYEPDLFPPLRYKADHRGVEGFRRTEEQEARWLAGLQQADILWDLPNRIIYGHQGMEVVPKVKWVQTTSSGVGQLFVKLGLQKSDLLITTASGVHADPLAEFFLLGVLMHYKRLASLQEEQKAHHWERSCGEDLNGKVLAVIGTGKVGQRIAQVGRFLGMDLLGMAAKPSSERATELGCEKMYSKLEMHDMLARADVVAVCVPHTPDTELMIDEAAFAAMKDGVVFVNVARGQVVDEPYLIAALQAGKVGFAALDVFATEPLPDENPLWDMPNVLISPHSASTVVSENAKVTDIFCYNLRCYLDGRLNEMKNILDKDKMY